MEDAQHALRGRDHPHFAAEAGQFAFQDAPEGAACCSGRRARSSRSGALSSTAALLAASRDSSIFLERWRIMVDRLAAARTIGRDGSLPAYSAHMRSTSCIPRCCLTLRAHASVPCLPFAIRSAGQPVVRRGRPAGRRPRCPAGRQRRAGRRRLRRGRAAPSRRGRHAPGRAASSRRASSTCTSTFRRPTSSARRRTACCPGWRTTPFRPRAASPIRPMRPRWPRSSSTSCCATA